MQTSVDLNKVKKVSFLNRLKNKFHFWFRLNNSPVIKVYNGYGNQEHLVVFGHVLTLSAMPRKTYRKDFITNFFSMLRLFMVKIYPGATLKLEWEGVTYETKSEDD